MHGAWKDKTCKEFWNNCAIDSTPSLDGSLHKKFHQSSCAAILAKKKKKRRYLKRNSSRNESRACWPQ